MAKPTQPEERDYQVEGKLVPLGYEQNSSLATTQALKPPQHARIARIQGLTQNIRWRDDGTDPDATTGVQLTAGNDFVYAGDLVKIRFIEETASAELNVLYYF